MVISLGWLSPATSRGLPAAVTTRAGSRCLFGLAPTGGYRAAPVTRRAVGSYPTFSPLPVDIGRFDFCGPVRRLSAPRRYLAICPMELGLSSTQHSSATPRPSRPAATHPKGTSLWRTEASVYLVRRRNTCPRLSPAAVLPAATQNPSFSVNAACLSVSVRFPGLVPTERMLAAESSIA